MRDLIIKAVSIYGHIEKVQKDMTLSPGIKKALMKYYKNEMVEIKKEMEEKENDKRGSKNKINCNESTI